MTKKNGNGLARSKAAHLTPSEPDPWELLSGIRGALESVYTDLSAVKGTLRILDSFDEEDWEENREGIPWIASGLSRVLAMFHDKAESDLEKALENFKQFYKVTKDQWERDQHIKSKAFIEDLAAIQAVKERHQSQQAV